MTLSTTSRSAMALFATLLVAQSARAETPAECSESQEIDRYQLLRRMSLTLRGHLPSYEEYLALDDETGVPDALVSEMLASDAFRRVMRRFHADLLWPNLNGVQIADLAHIIGTVRVGGQPADRWASVAVARRRTYRQGGGSEICGDWLQTEFTADGLPVTRTVDNGAGPYQEDGYVLVRPYWAPNEEIKVCAFEAQTAAEARLPNGNAVRCDSARGAGLRGCGCGPDLRWCFTQDVGRRLWADLAEQLGRLVDRHTVGGQPYSELLWTKTTFTSGPLDFWKRHLAHLVGLNRTFNARMPVDEVPPAEPDYTAGWVEAERQAPHAGILTLPGYTLRFQTNRARANRFRQVFTYQSFVPPATASDSDCDPAADDLTERCTCRQCHQVLEPLAAHFGGVAEAGSALIAGAPEEFPVYQPGCDPTLPQDAGRALPRACERFYVVDPDAHAPGTLLAHQYADIDDPLHRRIADNLAAGPEALAREAIDLGLVHSAVTRHLFIMLMGRDMILDPIARDNELALLDELTTEFRGHDDIRRQVERLVMLPQFRRVR